MQHQAQDGCLPFNSSRAVASAHRVGSTKHGLCSHLSAATLPQRPRPVPPIKGVQHFNQSPGAIDRPPSPNHPLLRLPALLLDRAARRLDVLPAPSTVSQAARVVPRVGMTVLPDTSRPQRRPTDSPPGPRSRRGRAGQTCAPPKPATGLAPPHRGHNRPLAFRATCTRRPPCPLRFSGLSSRLCSA